MSSNRFARDYVASGRVLNQQAAPRTPYPYPYRPRSGTWSALTQRSHRIRLLMIGEMSCEIRLFWIYIFHLFFACALLLPSGICEYRKKYAKIALASCFCLCLCFCLRRLKLKTILLLRFNLERHSCNCCRCNAVGTKATPLQIPWLLPPPPAAVCLKYSTPTQLIYLKIHFVFVFIFNCQIFCVQWNSKSVHELYIYVCIYSHVPRGQNGSVFIAVRVWVGGGS